MNPTDIVATPDGRHWIAFNGEVYNFQDVRRDLEHKGLRFQSTGDTEVICVVRSRGHTGQNEHVLVVDQPSAALLQLLEQDHVLAHPGYFFDFPSPGYLVVSLLPRPEIFDEGTARLVARLRRLA